MLDLIFKFLFYFQGEVEDPTMFDTIEPNFWCAKCGSKKFMGDNAPKVLLNLIRLVMFQNSYTLAQLSFYVFFVGGKMGGFEQTCFYKARGPWIFLIQCIFVVLMFMMNAMVTVPLYSLVAITTHHTVMRGKLHKKFKTVHHTLKDEFALIKEGMKDDHGDHDANKGKEIAKNEQKDEKIKNNIDKNPGLENKNKKAKTSESSKDGEEAKAPSIKADETTKSSVLAKQGLGIGFFAKETMLRARLERTKREIAARYD